MTETDIPTRRSLLTLDSFVLLLFKSDIDNLTGILWTTLTQFPEEFCGGKIENSAPVAGLILSTWAFHVLFGYESGINRADCPTFILVKSVSFKLASNHAFFSSTIAKRIFPTSMYS